MKPLHSPLLLIITLALTSLVNADFYIAKNGDDANPGTKAKPFATPARAVEAVRALAASGLKSDVRVVFRAGSYELAAPLVFAPADSGTAQHSITYAAAPGETVVISGGRRITNWRKAGGRKWTVELPDVKAGKWFFRQLVVNDRRAVRARWPKDDGALHIKTVGDGVKSFTFDQPLPKETLGGQDAELVVYENWSVSRAIITASDDKRLTTATTVGWIGHGPATTASPGKPVFIENARSLLDEPGEWFLERSTGALNYLAADGENLPREAAVAPALTQLVKIAGTKERPVRNLCFEGLRFEHADFPLPAFGYSEIQAAHYGTTTKEPTCVQPVAIECAYAEGIRFQRCRFAHLNASGVGFGPGCRKNAVLGCVIEDIGGNGVMIGWRGTGKLQAGAEGALDADWADPADAPTGNEIANCVIRRCAADSRGAVAVWVGFSADTRIAHNVIHDLPYTGVSIGYRWNTTLTSQARCIAEYNHIYDVMKKLADGGGIYTLGFQPGTVLRGNHIHDVHRSAYAQGGAPNNGFFLDQGSKGFLFEANVAYAASGGAVRFNQNQRDWHTWKDNLFDAAATPSLVAEARKDAGLQPEFATLADGVEMGPLWPDKAPVGDGTFEAANANLTVHLPAPDKANGAAVVICPGGGYQRHVVGAEGHEIARWLNSHGIAGIVLEYRMPQGRPFVPLLDAQRAIRYVRSRAADWRIAPDRIGIMGFSAGGHLASTAGTHFDDGDPKSADPVARLSCRPDFTILVYPVVTMGDKTHSGSKKNLLGPDPKPEMVELFSNEKQITAKTPPAFLAHAIDDKPVPPENSRQFAEAMKAHNVPVKYLELPNGGHGLNHYQGPSWDAWQKQSIEWLRAMSFTSRPALKP
jgi:acetyl esterase/lipase